MRCLRVWKARRAGVLLRAAVMLFGVGCSGVPLGALGSPSCWGRSNVAFNSKRSWVPQGCLGHPIFDNVRVVGIALVQCLRSGKQAGPL